MEREIVGLALALASGSCVVLACQRYYVIRDTRVRYEAKTDEKLDNSQGNFSLALFSLIRKILFSEEAKNYPEALLGLRQSAGNVVERRRKKNGVNRPNLKSMYLKLSRARLLLLLLLQ